MNISVMVVREIDFSVCLIVIKRLVCFLVKINRGWIELRVVVLVRKNGMMGIFGLDERKGWVFLVIKIERRNFN